VTDVNAQGLAKGREPSQCERFLAWLQARGPVGVHTFEMRRAFMGNPSQRRSELLALGFALGNRRERLNGRANGSRYWLAEHAPDGVRIERRTDDASSARDAA
jgi:hypothetical protein